MYISNQNKPENIHQEKILFCVLNWGIGHATRSAVLIRRLLHQNNQITIASDGDALLLLQKEFPDLPTIELPAYNIQYPSHPFFNLAILSQIPKIIRVIREEHELIQSIIHDYTYLISDNRYGCYSSKIPSIFIGHQLNIQTPYSILSAIVNRLHHHKIARFNAIWVPDDERNLSGKLSEVPDFMPLQRIGILSSFSPLQQVDKNIDLLIIISGPEPARTVFEEQIVDSLKNTHKKIVVVGGKIKEGDTPPNKYIEYHSYCTPAALNLLLAGAYAIACRSGYSTIMDLFQARFNRDITLIPTPGQTEQDYLAHYLSAKYPKISFMTQSDFIKTLN